MEGGLFNLLQQAGLTRYEALAYMSLLRRTVDSAAKLAHDSGVPRTKVYSVLRSLGDKGWIRVLSGRPLLYRINEVPEVIERLRLEHEAMLVGLDAGLSSEADGMMDKIVVMNRSLGLEGLREQLTRARRAFLSGMTWDLYGRLRDDLEGAEEVRVLFFPGEAPPTARSHEEFRLSILPVVHIVRGMEVPAQQAVLDGQRVFTIAYDPLTKRYEVDEMFTPDCVGCLMETFDLGWHSSPPTPSSALPAEGDGS